MPLRYDNPQSFVRILRSELRFSLALGLLTFTMGIVALMGWILKIAYLTSIVPGLATMKANTALSFLFLGCALALLSCRQFLSEQKSKSLVLLMATPVAIIAALTMAEYVEGIDFGIDQALFRDFDAQNSPHPPGRMSPITAVTFFLYATAIGAIVLFPGHPLRWQVPVLIGLFLTAIALLGHLYDASSLLKIYPYATVAIPTTIASIWLACGLLLLFPHCGLIEAFSSDGYGGIAGRRILPLSVITLFILGLIVRWLSVNGHFNTGFTVEFLVVLGATFISGIVWWHSKELNRLDFEQRQALRQLNQREGEAVALAYQLKLVVNHVPSAVAMFDRDMRYLWVSKRWAFDYGIPEENIAGLSHYELFPELPKRWKEVHEHCLAGAVERCNEDLFVRADGKRSWLRWEVRPWYSEAGEIGGIIIFTENITERKNAEDALQKAKDELEARVEERTHDLELQSTIVRNMAEGVCMVSASDERIVYVNPKFESAFGYVPGELNGKPVSILNFDDGSGLAQGRAREIIEQINARGQLGYEIQNVRKDGSVFWCRANTCIFKHSHYGTVYLAVQDDITEAKLAKEAIQKSEARFRGLLESAPDSMVIVDQDGKIEQVNIQAERTFGYDRSELSGKPIELLVPERSRAGHVAKRNRFIAAPSSRVMGAGLDLYARRKDGREFPVDISLSPLQSGERVVITAAIRDISLRKRIESELRESQERYRDLIERSPDAILINQNNAFQFVNTRAVQLFGASSTEQLLGASPLFMFHPDYHKLIQARIHRILDHHQAVETIPEQIVRFDGGIVDVEVTALPLQYRGGPAIMVIVHDITERKRQERIIESLAKSLDEAADAIIQRSLDDRITYWNKGAERLYGFTRAEALCSISHQLLKTDFPIPMEKIKTQDHWEGELLHTCKDGSVVTVSSRWTLRRDIAGRPNGLSRN